MQCLYYRGSLKMHLRKLYTICLLILSFSSYANEGLLKCWSEERDFSIEAEWVSTFEMIPLSMKINDQVNDFTDAEYLPVISYQENGFNFRVYKPSEVGIFIQIAVRSFENGLSTGLAKGFDLPLTEVSCSLLER